VVAETLASLINLTACSTVNTAGRMAPRFIHVLFIADDNGVFAQCLDFDVAAQGATFEEAEQAFFRTCNLQIEIDRQCGREPFSSLGMAPARFWRLAETVSEWHRREAPELPDIPPAYVIAARLDDALERTSPRRVAR
jgi:hypothetical protein